MADLLSFLSVRPRDRRASLYVPEQVTCQVVGSPPYSSRGWSPSHWASTACLPSSIHRWPIHR